MGEPRDFNFVRTFTGSIGRKAHDIKILGKVPWAYSQGVPTIFRAPIYRAHCAVIFAIAVAQLSSKSCTEIGRLDLYIMVVSDAQLLCNRYIRAD